MNRQAGILWCAVLLLLSLEAAADFNLTVTVSPVGAGIVRRSPAGPAYPLAQKVTLTPVANEGYRFDHWEGDLTGTKVPGAITMIGNKKVTAAFVAEQCALSAVTPIAPVSGSIVYVGHNSESLPLTFLALSDCVAETARVTFILNPNWEDFDWHTDATTPEENGYYSVAGPSVNEIGFGTHTLVVRAISKSDPGRVVENTITFTLAAADPAEDSNRNGLPDDSFGLLSLDGSSWMSAVGFDSAGVLRLSAAVRWEGASAKAFGDAPVTVSLRNPNNPAQRVTVFAPRELLNEGESGVLIVQMAPSLGTLLGSVEASILGEEPTTLIAGGQYLEISVIASLDGGGFFVELDSARFAENPLHVTIGGVDVVPGSSCDLFSHPTSVVHDPLSGDQVIAWQDSWTTDGIRFLKLGNEVIDADLVSLSVLAPYDVSAQGPRIATTPPGRFPYDYGFVEVGASDDASFTVTNVGGGILEGTAAVEPPFSIVSGGAYSLAPGQSQKVRVRFTPAAVQDYVGTVVFSNGGWATIHVRGSGFSKAAPIACPGGTLAGLPPRGASADLMLFAILAVALFLAGRRPARKPAN